MPSRLLDSNILTLYFPSLFLFVSQRIVISLADASSRKVAIVGDGACGKTSLLARFTLGYFPPHCLPTVFDSYVAEVRVDGRFVQLEMWDTADREDCEGLRKVAYSKADAILVGFSVDNPDSLENVRQKWVDETTENCLNVPVILVGLKKDVRMSRLALEETNQKSLQCVSPGRGSEMARQCGATQYLECSSFTGEGVDKAFAAATRAALLMISNERHRSGCCVIV